MNFFDAMKSASESITMTDNGAPGYSTTNNPLLDINYMVSSLRNESDETIISYFEKAYDWNKSLALRWLFFARDVRQGLGEKRLFQVCFEWWMSIYEYDKYNIIKKIPEYGSWKDVFKIQEHTSSPECLKLIVNQVREDVENVNNNKPISLCFKWMPSINTSSKSARRHAAILANNLGINHKTYRKLLSVARDYLDVVERKMSSNKWHEINYETVPSVANLKYANAFNRHDMKRRNDFFEKIFSGEKQIHSGVLFPHDIVSMFEYYRDEENNIDTITSNSAAEALWKTFPKNSMDNTLVVADGSRSMTSIIDSKGTRALDVANALAIYFAECNTGVFKDKYITFSENPQLVDLIQHENVDNPLEKKLSVCLSHNEVCNTNIEAVFELLMSSITKNNLKQIDLPKNIIIISDMEFDQAVNIGKSRFDGSLFDGIISKWNDAGIKMPRLIFWNVGSTSKSIPLTVNKSGVMLLSGYSINNVNMILSGELDPWKCLLSVIESDRYSSIFE